MTHSLGVVSGIITKFWYNRSRIYDEVRISWEDIWNLIAPK